jgi:hypothetical protein
MDCIIKIEYKDLYGNKYVKHQGVRIFVKLDDPSDLAVIFTFLEEMHPSASDFSLFGPPNSGPAKFAGFPDTNRPADFAAP